MIFYTSDYVSDKEKSISEEDLVRGETERTKIR